MGNTYGSDRYVDATVTYLHRTDDAVYIAFDNEAHWVPRSTLSWKCDKLLSTMTKHEEFEISIKEWMADKIGLRY